MGNRLIATDYNNFAPRLGIAWSPSEKWSVRAGFGFFYSQESKNSIFDLNRGLGGRTSYNPDNTYSPPQNITYSNFLNAAALPVNLPIGLVAMPLDQGKLMLFDIASNRWTEIVRVTGIKAE